MKKYIKEHKTAVIIILASVLAAGPFIWPFLLAALLETAGMAMPVLAAMVLLRIYDGWKDGRYRRKKGWKSIFGGRNAGREEKKQALKHADSWYESYGKKRLARLTEELEREGVREAWVRPDGTCSIRSGSGYRRRATLAEYPAAYAWRIAARLRDDGTEACMHGKYLYLSVPQNRRAA